MSTLPEVRLVAVLKRDCETCVRSAPVVGEVARADGLLVYTQDDPKTWQEIKENGDAAIIGVGH